MPATRRAQHASLSACLPAAALLNRFGSRDGPQVAKRMQGCTAAAQQGWRQSKQVMPEQARSWARHFVVSTSSSTRTGSEAFSPRRSISAVIWTWRGKTELFTALLLLRGAATPNKTGDEEQAWNVPSYISVVPCQEKLLAASARRTSSIASLARRPRPLKRLSSSGVLGKNP